MIDRRAFLKTGFGLAGAMLAGANFSLAQVSGPKRKILIIGAGLTGLSAAHSLRKLGHDVQIFEARDRPGGRIHTLRDFTGGQYADAGAARIPQNHQLTHAAVREFGLSVADFYPTSGKFVRLKNGRSESIGWDDFAEATGPVMYLEKPDHWKRIVGGTDQLPRAIALTLQAQISYKAPVSAISTGPKDVTIRLQSGDSVRGDVVICTVPVPLLKQIAITPALSPAKQQLIETAKYDAVVRVFLETRDRFWTKQNFNGFGFGERVDEIWESSFGQPGQGGILQSYNREPYAATLSQMPESERHNAVAASMEKLFAGLASQTVSVHSKCWSLDPWSRGAWAHLGPDQKKVLLQPENRIFFAGEHLSDNPSWMQGALQSADQVVERIAAALPVLSN
jgi:monoamine oxidase